MWHVDEGALHAYLDGALDEYPTAEARRVREHLEGCVECARRLEEEREVRHSALAILGSATPQVEIPTFEELRAYVKATRPSVSRLSVRLQRMGWAASVVLAVGIGWLARGGGREPATASFRDALGPGAAERQDQLEPSADDIGGGAAQGLARREELGAAGANEPSVGAASERREVQEGSARSDELATKAATELTAAVQAGGPASNVAADILAGRDALLDAVAAPQEPEPPAALPTDEAVEAAVVSARALEERPVLPQTLTVTPPALAVVAPTAAAATAAEDTRRRGGEQRLAPVAARIEVGAAAGSRAVDARPAEPEAEVFDEERDASLVVPGVEVLSYANLTEGTAPTGLHIVQRTANGVILDVYHLPEGADPSALPPLESGRNEVRAVRGGGWVIMRAMLSTDELRELLARLDA